MSSGPTVGYREAVEGHYGSGQALGARVLDALRNAGRDIDALTRADLAPIDQLHGGGLDATMALAKIAEISTDMHVLDVGCGIGGPARTLAADFGCRVTGLDLTKEFCRAAEMLTTRLGLGERVNFRHASALDMPFDVGQFDAVWIQNVSMNIEDKAQLYDEIRRVLKPRGRLALQEVTAGPEPELHFPVPWAGDPAISFLDTPEETRRLLVARGFAELVWTDLTESSIEFARKRRAATARQGPAALGPHVVLGLDFQERFANQLRNLEEGRTRVVQAVLDLTI